MRGALHDWAMKKPALTCGNLVSAGKSATRAAALFMRNKLRLATKR
jgi:hypothetical protein